MRALCRMEGVGGAVKWSRCGCARRAQRPRPSASRVISPGRMFVAMPTRRAVSFAMLRWSPVIIFTSTPASTRRWIVSAVSKRGGSIMGRRPRKYIGPPSTPAATAMVLYPNEESSASCAPRSASGGRAAVGRRGSREGRARTAFELGRRQGGRR